MTNSTSLLFKFILFWLNRAAWCSLGFTGFLSWCAQQRLWRLVFDEDFMFKYVLIDRPYKFYFIMDYQGISLLMGKSFIDHNIGSLIGRQILGIGLVPGMTDAENQCQLRGENLSKHRARVKAKVRVLQCSNHLQWVTRILFNIKAIKVNSTEMSNLKSTNITRLANLWFHFCFIWWSTTLFSWSLDFL